MTVIFLCGSGTSCCESSLEFKINNLKSTHMEIRRKAAMPNIGLCLRTLPMTVCQQSHLQID